jgi:predicted RNase H-like nuclease
MLGRVTTTVMGVDACKNGWIGVRLSDSGLDALFATTIGELAGLAGALAVMAIDIPIGLADVGMREADVQTKKLLKKHASSVFLTPVRAALAAASFEEAQEINREHAGSGFSIQAFGLRTKILQVDAWLRTDRPTAIAKVVETHPEACFMTMAGQPLGLSKKTWAGAELRRRLLADVGIELPTDLGAAGQEAAVDDVLDAAAAAWTARRVLDGTAQHLPEKPQVFKDGIESAIWF